MADIKLRIEVNPNAESEVLGTVTNNVGEISNTSIKANAEGEFQNIPTTEISGSNGLTWAYGYLVFNEDGYLDNVENSNAYLESEQSPDQFFWGAVPESKEYRVKLTFSNASNLKDIIIYGDKTNNQFPTEAIIDGETVVTSDDVKWAINLLTESDTHTIEFTKWNRANYNATITLIRIMLRYWEVDKFNGLKSVESLSQITGQPQDIFYGVVPSDGSAQIIDLNGEIYDMVNDGVIPNSNLKVEVFANGRKVQQHITEDTTYDNTQILEVAFTNSLSNWDNIKFNGMKLRDKATLYNILLTILLDVKYIKSEIEIYPMLSNKVYYEGLYITIENYLKNITVPYPYLEPSSLREVIDKVCTLAQLNVVENETGQVKFISAKPIIDIEKPIIKVTPKQILSNPYRDIVSKNKYNKINVTYEETYIEYQSYDTRTIGAWQLKDSTSDLGDTILQNYNNTLSSTSINPNVVVLGNNIVSEGLPGTEGQTNYFNIFKYTIPYDLNNIKNKSNFSHKMTHSLDAYIPGGESHSDEYDTYKSYVYPEGTDDMLIVSQWATIENNVPISVKTGITVFDYAVRRNIDNTLTIFIIEWSNISWKLPYPDGDNVVYYDMIVAIYKNASYTFQIETVESQNKELLTEYDYIIYGNELMQNGTKIYNLTAPDYLSQNISEDYSYGVPTAEIKVICSDLYDINGNKVKNWANGETYEIGDIIRVDRDNGGISLWNYKDGRPMYWQVVSRNFRKNGVPLVDLGLRECKYLSVPKLESVSFAEDDWDTIKIISSLYRAEEYYKVGDEKTITLSTGEQVTLQILGFNHDDLTTGGKANITIGMKNLLTDTYQMNTTASNNGGWKDCYFRNTVIPRIFATLPSDLQSAIKFVDKQCSYGDGTRNTYTISDNLFLFSEYEIFYENYFTLATEGKQYKYWLDLDPYNNPKKAFKYLNNGEGNSSYWWLRSPSDNNGMVTSINTNFSGAGAYNAYDWSGGVSVSNTSADANTYYGICLGFCI